MASTPERIMVEVVYATPQEQVLLKLSMVPGATVQAAIEQSGVLLHCGQIDLHRAKIGIFGRRVPLLESLSDGDRVEIYRELVADPKSVRRERAALERRRR